MSIEDIEIEESDCELIEPFELEDISIIEEQFNHEYPEYEVEDLPELDIGDNL